MSRVGDIVLAIGNPLGLGGTVTSGIISSINRDIGGGPYVDFIQTDAPINRGNSGGPLFNLDGEVIGINSMIISQTGGSVGLGFSIPSQTAKLIVEQIISFGQAKRGRLGVQIQDLTEEFSESLGYDSTEGAFVASVEPNSPAALSNIQAGDIIIEFNNQKITSFKDLPKVVAETPIDSEVIVKVWRNGEIIDIKVRVGELEEGRKLAKNDGVYLEELDITVLELTNDAISSLGLDSKTKGILVTEVGDKNENLLKNDVIIQVSSEKIKDITVDVSENLKNNRGIKLGEHLPYKNSLKIAKKFGGNAALIVENSSIIDGDRATLMILDKDGTAWVSSNKYGSIQSITIDLIKEKLIQRGIPIIYGRITTDLILRASDAIMLGTGLGVTRIYSIDDRVFEFSNSILFDNASSAFEEIIQEKWIDLDGDEAL